MFPDESGWTLDPPVRRTWGRRGQRPVLQVPTVHVPKVSALGAWVLSPRRRRVSEYLHLWHEDIDQEAVILFLRELLRHLPGVVIVIWDRWKGHCGKQVAAFLARHPRLQIEWLPARAPELNPQEQHWEHLDERHANGSWPNAPALLRSLGRSHRALCRQPGLLASYIGATPLPLRLPGGAGHC